MKVKQIVTLEITFEDQEGDCERIEAGTTDNCCGKRCGMQSKPLEEVDWAGLLRCCGGVKQPVSSIEMVGPVVKALV